MQSVVVLGGAVLISHYGRLDRALILKLSSVFTMLHTRIIFLHYFTF